MKTPRSQTVEGKRLDSCVKNFGWKKWGPYLSERQWGTVREDYSSNGDAWNSISYDMSRSYAYRWGEDGLGGFTDNQSLACVSLALWNGKDDHLKEKLFGLPNTQGNHGEDVKEIYYYLDSTPTHSYCKMQYLYPHARFPYEELKYQNSIRSRQDSEYELSDTEAIQSGQYFQVDIEYAKASEEDIVARYSVKNCGDKAAEITIIPQIAFRNRWKFDEAVKKPLMSQTKDGTIMLEEESLGTRYWNVDSVTDYCFTENETNSRFLYGQEASPRYTKDAFHQYVVKKDKEAVNAKKQGTKACSTHSYHLAPGETATIRVRFADHDHVHDFDYVDSIFHERITEADAFYEVLQGDIRIEDEKVIQRQALAGMMWSKQYYYYDVKLWLEGDPGLPKPHASRQYGRNRDWEHLNNADIISMPDVWEYPWYAAWDLAFHCIPLALIDPQFAKRQLTLILKEWYQHPNGQIPAYEWNFSDVNPPVHAWACHRVFQIDAEQTGKPDYFFLERVFHKLLINFTWWVNQKDLNGNNVFQGGFLGLDNIGVFDRSAPLPGGGHIDQADGTAWMAFYSLGMMKIALELAQVNSVYEDTATKFFEHFLHIAEALNSCGPDGQGLWDEDDGFYYDILHQDGKDPVKLKVRSMVGIIPLFATEVIEPEFLEKVPHFKRRMKWTFENRPQLARHVSYYEEGNKKRHLLSLVSRPRLQRILDRVFDSDAFYSDYGVRSLSKEHLQQPYHWAVGNANGLVSYLPGESDSGMFGGNSNWRGPVWFPLNYLLYESLQKHVYYYGDDLVISELEDESLYFRLRDMSNRLIDLFRTQPTHHPDLDDRNKSNRPCHFGDSFQHEHPLFYEYFHGDSGKGLGAAHQTGWTGLVAQLIDLIHKKKD